MANALMEETDRTFPNDPNPPAQPPKVDLPKSSAPAPTTSAGTGALPPESAAGAGATLAPAASPTNYSVVEHSDGTRDIYASTKNDDSKFGTVNVPDADKILHATGTYDEKTKTWTNVPEATVKALTAGRPAPVEYWKQQFGAGEAGMIISQNGRQFLDDKNMTGDQVRTNNHMPTLQAQLAERPDMAWTGKMGIAADFLKNPISAISHGAEKVPGEIASWIAPILQVTKDTLKGAGLGALAAAPVAGGAILAGGGPENPLGDIGAAGIEAFGAKKGAQIGALRSLYRMESGNIASDWLGKGIPDETVRTYAPYAGAIKAAMWMGMYKMLPAPGKQMFLQKLAASEAAQKVLANWAVRFAGEAVSTGSVMAAQSKIQSMLNNMVAETSKRPDLMEDPKDADLKALEAGLTGLTGGAAIALPGAAIEGMTGRIQTAPALEGEPKSFPLQAGPPGESPESVAGIEQKGTTKPSVSSSPSGAPGVPSTESIPPEVAKVKAMAEEEARPFLEKHAEIEGRNIKDPKFALDLYQKHNDIIHQAKEEMGIGKDLTDMKPEEKVALMQRLKEMPDEDKARIEKAFSESGPIVAALQRKVYMDRDPATAAMWAKAEAKIAGGPEGEQAPRVSGPSLLPGARSETLSSQEQPSPSENFVEPVRGSSTWSITDNPELRNTPFAERQDALLKEEANRYGVSSGDPRLPQLIADRGYKESEEGFARLREIGEMTKNGAHPELLTDEHIGGILREIEMAKERADLSGARSKESIAFSKEAEVQRAQAADEEIDRQAAARKSGGGGPGEPPPPTPPGGGGAETPPPEREFFKNPEIDIKPKETEKATAKDIRAQYVGDRDAQIALVNQKMRSFKRAVPEELDRRAATWWVDTGGDKAQLAEMLENPKLKEYHPEIERALNLPENAQKWAETAQRYFAEAAEVGQERGTLNATRENYVNRLYMPEKEKGDFVQGAGPVSGVSRTTGHAQERVFDTMADAATAGKKFATTDLADLVTVYNSEIARANAARAMADSMVESGLGAWKAEKNIPEGWEQVGGMKKDVPIRDQKTGEAVIGEGGDQVVSRSLFVAPKGIAKGLAAIAEPNFTRKIDVLRGLQQYQGLVKTVDLSFSLFHHLSMIAQLAYAGDMSSLLQTGKMDKILDSPDFAEREQEFVRHGGATAITSDNQDILRNLVSHEDDTFSKITNLPVVKQVLQGADKSADFLFGKVQRMWKVNTFSNLATNWVADHPNATPEQHITAMRELARHVNDRFGGQNWEAMGMTKSNLSLLRIGMLAPDWTTSNLHLLKSAIGEGGAGGRASRIHVLSSLMVGMAATEGLNHLLTGHFTDQNKKGHELEVEIAPNVYVSLLRGGVQDITKLASMVMESGLGGVSRFAQGKLSPVVRTGVGLLTNTQYTGQQIMKKKEGPIASTYEVLKYALGSLAPVPLGITNLMQYAQTPQATIGGGVAVATGVGRFSKPPKRKK
jgi:hypothetical protein